MLQVKAKSCDKKVDDWISKDCEFLFDEFGNQDCRGVHMYSLHDSIDVNNKDDDSIPSNTTGIVEEITSMDHGKLSGEAESLGYVTLLHSGMQSSQYHSSELPQNIPLAIFTTLLTKHSSLSPTPIVSL